MRRSAALAALAGLAGCARPVQRAVHASSPPGKAVHLVAIGDSLALGTGASAPENAFIFRAFLALRERHPGSRLDNDAIGGSTAADVSRLQVPRLASTHADIVVVCVGGNDVVRRVSAAPFARTYEAIVAGARRLQPRAKIVCCGVPDVGMSPLFTGADHTAVVRLSRELDDAVRTIAARHGALFADLYAPTARSRADAGRFLSDDRFHPSDAGYAILAGVLEPVLLRAAT